MKLPPVYEAKDYEPDIYSLWEKSGVFVADPNSPKPHFAVSMPPPNETAVLHLGGALFLTLQDIIVRHARQKGYDALWLPGTDHAAIATNTLVEKQLAKEGTGKHELGREAFLDRVRQFAGDNRETILAQMRAMGASCDWTRLRYTLDETLNRCVNEVFVKMYNDGLIYRGHRIVNWDPNMETTVSDDEVIYKEEKSPLYTLQYGPFQISTARPETKFGDKYVVMHPGDKRYAGYKSGDTFECQWINGPVTATIIKDEAVDPNFGTGVMTITPWHYRTDFEIAERHGLEKDQIIGFDGRLLPIAGEFAGMTIDEARPKIIKKLKTKNLLVGIDQKYSHNIALNSRGKGVIEPQIKLQWFVDVNRPALEWKGQMRSFKEVMRAVIEDGDIKIIPKRFEKIYFHWIDNLRDWCISRQIWWGHRVPVWYPDVKSKKQKVKSKVQEEQDTEIYVGVRPPAGKWIQDPDTLDTWFSSALWTWSTLIDPKLATDYSLSLEGMFKKSLDYRTYHPTSVMETGWDILFFWVARMILATTYVTGQVPFKTVYLHGLVRTEAGKKMSKSDPDTIVDPMEVIPQYGTDALRLALVSGTTAGNDQRLGKTKIAASRNFCNKLWNIARFVQDNDNGPDVSVGVPTSRREGSVVPKTIADHWILNKLSISAKAVSKDLGNFRFSEAYNKLYHFAWDDLADWYIEASKVGQGNPDGQSGPRSEHRGEVLSYVLESTLKLAHPFAPFVTETIWQNSGHTSLLAAEAWPQIAKADKKRAGDFDKVIKLVREIRRISNVLNTKFERVYYKDNPVFRDQENIIEKLAGISNFVATKDDVDDVYDGVRLTEVKQDVWIDIEPKKYFDQLAERLKMHKIAFRMLEGRLQSQAYLNRAPASIVQQSRDLFQYEKDAIAKLEDEMKHLKL